MAVQHPDRALVTVRAGNIVGGGDWATDRLVPDAGRALRCRSAARAAQDRRGAAVAIRARRRRRIAAAGGSGLRRSAKILRRLEFCPPSRRRQPLPMSPTRWCGTGDRRRIGGRAGRPASPRRCRLSTDSSKAADHLDLEAAYGRSKSALKQTVAGIAPFYAGADMPAITSKQIDEHCSTRY